MQQDDSLVIRRPIIIWSLSRNFIFIAFRVLKEITRITAVQYKFNIGLTLRWTIVT